MKLKILAVAGLGMVLAFALPAQATWITIGITGIVDYIEDLGEGDGYLDGLIGVGDNITGYYTYDTDTPDTNPSVYVGDYQHSSSPFGIFLSIGSFNFSTDLSNVNFLIEIVNDYQSGDDYSLGSFNNPSLSNGSPVEAISWWINDPDGSALSSTELLATAPVLPDWQYNLLRIDTYRKYTIDGHVTEVEIVPEPTTFLLLALGGIALTKRRS